jgi:hypothetical protein
MMAKLMVTHFFGPRGVKDPGYWGVMIAVKTAFRGSMIVDFTQSLEALR